MFRLHCFRLPWTRVMVLLSALFSAGSAAGQTASTTMVVSATVVKVCIVATTPIAFGSYTPSSASPVTATATISVTCTNGTSYELGLDAGTGSGASTATRKLTITGDTLNYQLFRDSSYSLTWGNSTGADVLTASGVGSLVTHTIYGRIAAGQYRTPGAYTDTVTITVSY
jgi:spore coat protein U-like protein